MIKVFIKNMSCGHCQLKIKAELEANNYEIVKINMSDNSALINTELAQVRNIERILDSLNYVLDENKKAVELLEYTIWDEKLNDENNYDKFFSYLVDRGTQVTGFNEDNFGLMVFCSKKEYEEIMRFIELL